MFKRIKNSDDQKCRLDAIDASHAVIQFTLDGTIVTANANFLNATGYTLEDIKGKHHRMFVAAADRDAADYKAFWQDLAKGNAKSGEYKRVDKSGNDLWLQATYAPLVGSDGKPYGVLKVCFEITEKKRAAILDAAMIASINQSQAVIQFELDGTIISANENFLKTVGYDLSEIKGRHHSMFVRPAERNSQAYQDFWRNLRNGEFGTGEYRRVGKNGTEIWLHATYNPIHDPAGKLVGVVKFASDITDQKMRTIDLEGQINAITESQAVIEFGIDGIVTSANQNFLNALGYSLNEIKGEHHRIFVDPTEQQSTEYQRFWENLRSGHFQAGEFKRIGRGGKVVWIQASYNPIKDADGTTYKIVKFAIDTTAQVIARQKSERVRDMMETVAAGAEELNASVREISEAMTKSRDTALSAVQQVSAADQQAVRLGAAAQAMKGILGLIAEITGQINLLALNATIESARAGEAGRGFAVVASEVKSLANQAKQATDKIASEIDTLNGISVDVIDSLGSIKAAIDTVSEYVTSTAAAIEEQSTVTSEMSSSMQRAASEAAA
jgi:methyl-accepting chemotaxis protein